MIEVYFSVVLEDPPNVFNFQTSIVLRSKYCSDVFRNALDTRGQIYSVSDDGEPVFSVELSYLKWNRSESTKAPLWCISSLPEFQESAQTWIADWASFGEPLVNSIGSLEKALEYCENIEGYRSRPWVKSDGYTFAAGSINLGLLYAQSGRLDKARALLAALGTTFSVGHPLRGKALSALEWLNKDKASPK